MGNFYDVIVVGAGHAGCEAALASARLGARTLLLTISLEQIAHMPCNPSIGGTGKGQLVKEIDALGGEMGVIIDKAFLQSRMLNRSKGPAVWSPRAQADKARYHAEMKRALERQAGLHLRQGEVERLLYEGRGDVDTVPCEGGGAAEGGRPRTVAPTGGRRVCGVSLRSGGEYFAKAVVLATGTYLGSRVFVGDRSWEAGPSGFSSASALAASLKEDGFALRRFKTGTPARVYAWSLDYEKLIEQRGDEDPKPFSYLNDEVCNPGISCWLGYTNEDAHRVVANNITKTAPYGGHTTGVGPRYCLSIEDKVDRFPERERHQLFLEPEGAGTDEVYIQGMSTSLPEGLQEEFYRKIEGLEGAVFSRYAYSIEYECLNPLDLTAWLEHKGCAGLFCAGQLNGTSGYEEAAAQGLMAGINAARAAAGKGAFVLGRGEAYIGVLIDDLVTKGTEEPYRIMTSRAEFRLALRQDNADLRLTEKGWELGLASRERYERCLAKRRATEAELLRLRGTRVSAEAANEVLASVGGAPVSGAVTLAELLARPEVGLADLDGVGRDDGNRGWDGGGRDDVDIVPYERGSSARVLAAAREQAEIEIKYAGYIEKQRQQIAKFERLEQKRLPESFDYPNMEGLRLEARQKLAQVRPASLGQAARISGVSPADVSVLMVHLARAGGQSN